MESVVVVGRLANVEATHAMFDWIAAQLERFAQAEWLEFDAAQRLAIAEFPEAPWCPECEDWPPEDETYRADGILYCAECDTPMLTERPVVRAFTWKTALYRGALLRIKNRLYEQRKTQQSHRISVTALVVRTEQENQDYIARQHGELREQRSRRRGYQAGAYQRGKERGADVSLSPLSSLRSRNHLDLPAKS